ncbi:MAG: hypothetical protein EOP49_01740, partial [Sphingobacteriales bacterium]
MKDRRHVFSLIFFIASILCCIRSLAQESTPTTGFEENKGQLYDQEGQERNDILYAAVSGSFGIYLKKAGVSYQLFSNGDPKAGQFKVQRVDIAWPGASPEVQIERKARRSGFNNYHRPRRAILDVHSFDSIIYQGLYDHIDLVYYQTAHETKYDYIVGPGGRPDDIRLHIAGGTLHLNADGTLDIKTASGTVREGKPIVYQEGRQIDAAWLVNGDVLQFNIGSYNKGKVLVIDPLVGAFSDQQGAGGGYVNGSAVTTDKNLDMYWVGSTSFIGGDIIRKTDTGGNFKWSKQLGSVMAPTSRMNAVASAGIGIYIAGTTDAPGLATSGAFKTVGTGPNSGFLVKLDGLGNKIWGTYYGPVTHLTSCSVDGSGNVIIAGGTSETSGFSTPGSYQPANAGLTDGFITKFDGSGNRIWTTYFGGPGKDHITAIECRGESLFVCGNTQSASGISTPGVFQPNLSGMQNAFIAKFDTAGFRIWCSYVGGDSTSGSELAVASGNKVYLTGSTATTSGIATPGATQVVHAGGWDSYLLKFDDNGNRMWGTYIGGVTDEFALGCSAAPSGRVYVSGHWNFMYLYEYDSLGNFLWGRANIGNASPVWGNCWGGQNHADSLGNIYLTGALRTTSLGLFQAFATKFSPVDFPQIVITAQPRDTICDGGSALLSAPFLTDASYVWKRDGVVIPGASTSTFQATLAGTYQVVFIYNSYRDSAAVDITVLPAPSANLTINDISCNGLSDGSISVAASGVTGPLSIGWVNHSSTSGTISGLTQGTYTYIITDANGCKKTDSVVITEPAVVSLNIEAIHPPCSGSSTGSITVVPAGGTQPYYWQGQPVTAVHLQGLAPGVYPLHISDAHSCSVSDTVVLVASTDPLFSDPLAGICLVSTDSLTARLRVVWENTGDVHAYQYRIYRENATLNLFELAGTQAAGSINSWLDHTVDPSQQSYRYRISEMDSCGNESALSDVHRSLHLTGSEGMQGEVNLLWTPYEGRTYSSSEIMCSVDNGPFRPVAQVAAGVYAFTDINPPSGEKA